MLKKAVIISFLVALLANYYYDIGKDVLLNLYKLFNESKVTPREQLFTVEELKLYNGIERPELYLALLGNIFDVTKGKKHYGPNEAYNIFVGRDASRSFITGKFDEKEISDEVADFNDQDLRSINNWLKFYKKDYKKIGKLKGKYYDENGKLTAYGKQVKILIKQAESSKKNDALEKMKFPPCNVEWDMEKGTKVWCTDRSGGIERSWAGKPRQLFEPGSNSYRCACISEENEHLGNNKPYDDCDENSDICFVAT